MTYLIPLIVFTLGQIVKILIAKIQYPNRKLFSVFDYGGMPSTHTAIVASLATVVGAREGLSSTTFGIAVIFSIIVIYDAIRLRAIVGEHSSILNKLRADASKLPLPETVGHSTTQVIAGVVFGIIISLLLLMWFG